MAGAVFFKGISQQDIPLVMSLSYNFPVLFCTMHIHLSILPFT